MGSSVFMLLMWNNISQILCYSCSIHCRLEDYLLCIERLRGVGDALGALVTMAGSDVFTVNWAWSGISVK